MININKKPNYAHPRCGVKYCRGKQVRIYSVPALDNKEFFLCLKHHNQMFYLEPMLSAFDKICSMNLNNKFKGFEELKIGDTVTFARPRRLNE
jgi:hypothetical protein